MVCGTSVCLLKSVVVVAGLAAVGMGGYNFATTGCPLGSCSGSEKGAAMTPASLDNAPHGCCAGSTEAEGAVLLTAAPVEEKAGHCAGGAMASCPVSGAAVAAHEGGECPMGATCEGVDPADCPPGCELECPHELPVEQVAETVPVSDKSAG